MNTPGSSFSGPLESPTAVGGGLAGGRVTRGTRAARRTKNVNPDAGRAIGVPAAGTDTPESHDFPMTPLNSLGTNHVERGVGDDARYLCEVVVRETSARVEMLLNQSSGDQTMGRALASRMGMREDEVASDFIEKAARIAVEALVREKNPGGEFGHFAARLSAAVQTAVARVMGNFWASGQEQPAA